MKNEPNKFDLIAKGASSLSGLFFILMLFGICVLCAVFALPLL